MASSATITALFPPNSKIVFPNLLWTTSETLLPVLVDPVKDTKEILGSLMIASPITCPAPYTKVKTP